MRKPRSTARFPCLHCRHDRAVPGLFHGWAELQIAVEDLLDGTARMDTPEDIAEAIETCESHAEMYRERLLSTEFGLWNTLAALDGLFISAASVIASFGDDAPRWCLLCVIGACSISIILLIWNFRARRAMYRILGVPPPRGIFESDSAARVYFQGFQAKQAQHRMAQKRSEIGKQSVTCFWSRRCSCSRLPSIPQAALCSSRFYFRIPVRAALATNPQRESS